MKLRLGLQLPLLLYPFPCSVPPCCPIGPSVPLPPCPAQSLGSRPTTTHTGTSPPSHTPPTPPPFYTPSHHTFLWDCPSQNWRGVCPPGPPLHPLPL